MSKPRQTQHFAEIEYCLQNYFNSQLAPVMKEAQTYLTQKQVEEIGAYHASTAGVLRSLANGANGMPDDSLPYLRQTGEWNSKTTEDYVAMCRERIAATPETVEDLSLLAGEWRNAVVAEIGREQYEELSKELGGDLAFAYVDYRVEQMMAEGAAIIDIGAYSSRPNAEHISAEEEMNRLRTGLEILNRNHPEAIISVDTFRADVAAQCVNEYGVAIINDIAAGEMDDRMFQTVAGLGVPYIMMHMQGTPQNMQKEPHYDNLIKDVFLYFARKVQQLRDLGVKDIILDPGFGFGKTLEHNYELMAHLEEFRIFELPLLVGVSRKSMIYKLLGGTPQDSLNGTTILDTVALMKGAHILRVHDVREAVEAVRIVEKLKSENDVF